MPYLLVQIERFLEVEKQLCLIDGEEAEEEEAAAAATLTGLSHGRAAEDIRHLHQGTAAEQPFTIPGNTQGMIVPVRPIIPPPQQQSYRTGEYDSFTQQPNQFRGFEGNQRKYEHETLSTQH